MMLHRRVAGLVAVGLVAATLVGCQTSIPGAQACSALPADNIWHASTTDLPVHARSAAFVTDIGRTAGVHADFGSGLYDGGPIGIPFITVPGNQARVNVTFDYDSESDHGTYPIPANAPIEGGPNSTGDRHVLVVDRDNCKLYELYSAYKQGDGSWHAGSGAIFDLRSNALRTDTWTSADAAGLPILPGLVTYEEVAAGRIDHAIRITIPRSQQTYLWPARHEAGSTADPNVPPMGLRLRLKSSVDPNSYPVQARPIVVALETYGAIVADNGSPWFISGVPDSRWDNDALHELGRIKGSDWEAVDESSLMVSNNSGQARTP
jgi:hypothetical protein